MTSLTCGKKSLTLHVSCYVSKLNMSTVELRKPNNIYNHKWHVKEKKYMKTISDNNF